MSQRASAISPTTRLSFASSVFKSYCFMGSRWSTSVLDRSCGLAEGIDLSLEGTDLALQRDQVAPACDSLLPALALEFEELTLKMLPSFEVVEGPVVLEKGDGAVTRALPLT